MISNFFYKKLIIISLIFLSSKLSGIENKIIFKINDNAFTTLDYENRLEYLNFVGNNSNLSEEIVIDDFISANIFYEYYKNSNDNTDYELTVNKIFNNIIEANKKRGFNNIINEENILFNIKIDYARKTILENILNANFTSFNKSNEDIDLLYNFTIKYISFKNRDNTKIINKIKILEKINIQSIELILKENGISYYYKTKEINNINKIDKRIKDNIIANNDYFFLINNNVTSIIFIEKKFETLEGLIGKIYSVRSLDVLNDEYLQCNNLSILEKNNDNIISKEYKFADLNNEIKKSLININDFLKLNNGDQNVYIVLCEITYDHEILNNIEINKLINKNANIIESKFINKYSKLYNVIKNDR